MSGREVDAAGVLGSYKLRQLHEAGYTVVKRETVDQLLLVGNEVLNGEKDVSYLDDLLARLHREAS